MSVAKKTQNKVLRQKRVRAKISGTTLQPRLRVTVSNKQVAAQIINDESGTTLASSTSQTEKSLEKATMTEKATWVGAAIAKAAKTAKVTKVVFDRGGRPYQGRVKALAEAARENGLEF